MSEVKPNRLMDRRDEIVLGLYAFFIPAIALATMLHAG